jgi:hypothetical protein
MKERPVIVTCDASRPSSNEDLMMFLTSDLIQEGVMACIFKIRGWGPVNLFDKIFKGRIGWFK